MSWHLGTPNLDTGFILVTKKLEQNHKLEPTTIYFQQTHNPQLKIDYFKDRQQAFIEGSHPVHFYRGLSLLAEMQEKAETQRCEQVYFEELNLSLETSRNGVMKVEQIQNFIVMMAMMGYTGLYLYMEDTFEIPGQPYFGYMRGRYTEDELKIIVAFADNFGIEVVPSIQTLAHLTQMLKWEEYQKIKEDDHTLLVEHDETYSFIREMLKYLKGIFPSQKIHIGMDESYGVGVGNYLQENAYIPRFDLIHGHLQKVLEIGEALHLHLLVWSDFIYHTLDNKQLTGYYSVEAEIDEEKAQQMPQNVTYVYWDYGETDEKKYQKRISNHQLFAKDVMFAGGVHMYGAMTPNHGKSVNILAPALATCKKEKVKKVMLTTWGDDGQEINHYNALPIMQWYAEHCYHQKVVEEKVAQRFTYCVAPYIYDTLMNIRFLDEVPGVEEGNHYMANPSKFLLWQDPLLGFFDKHVEIYQQKYDLNSHYHKISDVLDITKDRTQQFTIFDDISSFYMKLAKILEKKATLGVELTNAYQENNLYKLKQICHVLPILQDEVNQLKKLHRKMWMETYKPFGWEVLESRYATLEQRLFTTLDRIHNYMNGDIQRIGELEEPRLLFMQGTTPLSIHMAEYRKIVFTGYN